MKTTIFALVFWSTLAWGQETPRRVWIEGPRAGEGELTYSLKIDDFSEVLAIEVDLLHDSQQAPVLRVRQKALLHGFIAVDNVVGDVLKIVLARAVAIGGGGVFVEVVIEDTGVPPELGFAQVALNAGQIPVDYEKVEPAASPGDFNDDSRVDFSDFFLFADHFRGSAGDPGFDPLYDMDEDGEIGFSDFFLFADLFGTEYH